MPPSHRTPLLTFADGVSYHTAKLKAKPTVSVTFEPPPPELSINEDHLVDIERITNYSTPPSTSWTSSYEDSHDIYFCDYCAQHNLQHHREWQPGNLIKRRQDFQVTVGVAGSTGSGKTSALNALLGYRELLPTDNAEAATAVPCKIAYNSDIRPEFKFRALVTFRKREDLVKQLDQLFEDLKGRNELHDILSKSDEDLDALRLINSIVKPSLELVKTVFGLRDDEIKGMTTDDLLARNVDVDRVLGTTKCFHGSKPDEFSDTVRHYMDSTSAKHGDHGLNFPAWPLVDGVEILVKSDILRNGVVLVDLPGLADSVESRAAVAERYFPQLAATLIVSPARRAADDSTSVKLLSDHQELRMKLDGKFHKRGYCVVVSQIDEIERRSDFKKEWAKSNKELQQLIKREQELKSQRAKAETEKRKVTSKLSKLKAELQGVTSKLKKIKGPTKESKISSRKVASLKSKRTSAITAVTEQKLALTRLKEVIYGLEKSIKDVEGNIIFLCVKERNRILTERIQQDFQTRQALLASNRGDEMRVTYDGQVSICPISSKAYWQCSDEEEILTGFPSRQYSGIPNLKEWISHSTIPEREAHADSLLCDLINLFNMIQTWSKEGGSQSRLFISKELAEKEIMSNAHDHIKKELDEYWEKFNQTVQKKNPLQDKKGTIGDCVRRCIKIVRGWSYKHPGDDASPAKIHWNTYQANIRRNGGRFTSRSGRDRMEYYWMQDVSDVLLETIVQDWNNALNHDILNLGNEAFNAIDAIWENFLTRLRIHVQETLPQLLPFLDDVIHSLDPIKSNISDQVRQALVAISKNASHVHPETVNMIQMTWKPAFRDASEECGSLARRKHVIAEFASKNSWEMYNTAFTTLADRLRKSFGKFSGRLDNISALAVNQIEAHIHAFLDNISPQHDAGNGALMKKAELQQYVRNIVLQWDLEWKAPETFTNGRMNAEDVVLPTTYYQTKEDDIELDDDESMTMDDGDTLFT
ncbi:uncharacterized protein GGS22DRAFT_198232 [Annulohypoxylon maeteangense]|uniref:uncharacterized protein n=1 Tax=Annulohypoxylon maeteangense TaxID=1927788 RepID=UPI002008C5EA|nr:uncharacterized protein GGS22DRAFT_198232 [Annulohypoxylon maeteangense]KAI0888522.1 hypothetical protein GGS22DRAFT_198232 [Annulohypoxylon maeteangense]